jgi:hypothetical protein
LKKKKEWTAFLILYPMAWGNSNLS